MNLALIRSSEFWESHSCLVAMKAGEEHPATEGLVSCVLFRTSGTTGEGRWIVLSKAALQISANAVNQWLGVDQDSRWGLSLPLNHVGGFGVVARTHAAGCSLSAFGKKWDAQSFHHWLGEESVTHVSLVPTQVHDLVAAGLYAPASLRAIVVGGGRLDENLGQAARDKGWPVLASFGMTETCSQVATQDIELLSEKFSNSPIKILPIWKTELSDEGLLKIKGDALFEGFFEKQNSQWIYRKRLEQWLLTNDRAELKENAIYPKGRADSVVKIMGELVDIEAVERRFLAYAGKCIQTGQFGLVAIPEERREHALIAVFRSGTEGIQEIYTAWQKKAEGIERFSDMILLEELPVTELGKLKRGALREIVTRQQTEN